MGRKISPNGWKGAMMGSQGEGLNEVLACWAIAHHYCRDLKKCTNQKPIFQLSIARCLESHLWTFLPSSQRCGLRKRLDMI